MQPKTFRNSKRSLCHVPVHLGIFFPTFIVNQGENRSMTEKGIRIRVSVPYRFFKITGGSNFIEASKKFRFNITVIRHLPRKFRKTISSNVKVRILICRVRNPVKLVASKVSNPDSRWSEKLNPNSGALEAQNVAGKAVDAQNGGVEAEKLDSGGFVDKWSQILITLMRNRIRICIRVKR